MKDIKVLLGDTKPKNQEKIRKASEKGECAQYVDQFLAEVAKLTAIDFPMAKCIVTDNYFCAYDLFTIAFSKTLTIIPLSNIVNLYRSNISVNGDYDYANFHLDVELKDGQKKHVATVIRNAKNFATVYEGVISCVRSRISIMGV